VNLLLVLLSRQLRVHSIAGVRESASTVMGTIWMRIARVILRLARVSLFEKFEAEREEMKRDHKFKLLCLGNQ
jgi:hypothetical protein